MMNEGGQEVGTLPSRRARAAALAGSGGAIAILMAVMFAIDRASFLAQDKANQYLPVARDIGRRLSSGELLPVIDPNLGAAGNFALDIQYGVFDPVHLFTALVLSKIPNLQLAAFTWALVFEVIFALGTTALCFRLRLSAGWASAAGFAAATCGWVFFKLSPVWIPGLVSIAWLPWVWWAWVGARGQLRSLPKVRDCVGVAVFSYLVIAGGWPATWLAFAALLAGIALETVVGRAPGARGRALAEPVLVRGGAAVAGVISAGLCALPLYHALPYTNRVQTVRNNNFLTGNLADMLSFAAPQLHGDIRNFDGGISIDIPVYFAVWFAVVVLWSVRWSRTVWRRPGLVTCALGGAVMLLLTQGPSAIGPLRDQIRELSGVQFFFAVAVCALASSQPWVITRLRILGIFGSLAAMGWISWSRDPHRVQAVGIVVVAVAAAALVAVAWRALRLTGVAALVATFGLTLMAFLAVWESGSLPTMVKPRVETAGKLGLTLADEPIFDISGSGSGHVWSLEQTDGVGHAFTDLRAGARIAPGYSSIGQRYFSRHMCIDALGLGCAREPVRLFQREQTTGRTWADLLGYRTVVVAHPEQRLFESVAPPQWHLVQQGLEFAEYQRSGRIAVAGRVTDVIGQATISAESLDNQTQSYHVSSPNGARLVFRDLYWPGYVATLNGHSLSIDPLDKTFVSVRLPAGSQGTLRVSYRPLSTASLVVLPLLSFLLLLGVAIWSYRRTRTLARVDGDEEADEPGHRDPLENPV